MKTVQPHISFSFRNQSKRFFSLQSISRRAEQREKASQSRRNNRAIVSAASEGRWSTLEIDIRHANIILAQPECTRAMQSWLSISTSDLAPSFQKACQIFLQLAFLPRYWDVRMKVARGICPSCALEMGNLHNHIPAHMKGSGVETLLLWCGRTRQSFASCHTPNSAHGLDYSWKLVWDMWAQRCVAKGAEFFSHLCRGVTWTLLLPPGWLGTCAGSAVQYCTLLPLHLDALTGFLPKWVKVSKPVPMAWTHEHLCQKTKRTWQHRQTYCRSQLILKWIPEIAGDN